MFGTELARRSIAATAAARNQPASSREGHRRQKQESLLYCQTQGDDICALPGTGELMGALRCRATARHLISPVSSTLLLKALTPPRRPCLVLRSRVPRATRKPTDSRHRRTPCSP